VTKEAEAAPIRMSPRRADAFEKMISEMSMYDGVKLMDVMEAVYVQGRKDGARTVFERIDLNVVEAKRSIPFRGPGRPRRSH
jgi:sulfate adenylyltransferase subunit 1 (EFTu-like GTPase family)